MITLREQIAQMLIMGFSGTAIDDANPIKNGLSEDGIGGVLLFDYDLANNRSGKNLVDQTQIKKLTKQLNECAQRSASAQAGLPLFIALDYEGGAVDRLKHIEGCGATLAPRDLAELPSEKFHSEVKKMAAMLKSLGFNLNFAPLVDLHLDESSGIIGKLGRSFSAEPQRVAELAEQFVEQFAEYGIACSYKHFPGHGSALGDTHQGFVDVTDTFQMKELDPYRLLLRNNQLPVMVMTAHVINRQLDQTELPATLSEVILTGLLRQELGFDGVIVSDDLQMHAISQYYSIDEALKRTINAGANLLIFANQLGEITASEVIDRIEQLVLSGAINPSHIEHSYQRISRLKKMIAA